MSWSKTFTCSIGSIARAAELVTPSLTTGWGETEQREALRLAEAAAIAVAPAVGGPDDEVRVTLSGHANEGLVKKGGWASDEVRISITRTA